MNSASSNLRAIAKHVNFTTIAAAAARNMGGPHPDFAQVQASRPDAPNRPFTYTKTVSPEWKFGSGANKTAAAAATSSHVVIDPYEPGRPPGLNYKLLISSIVPRPIALLSTLDAQGRRNLAPFSYFNVMGHDPPMFAIGFSSPVDPATKDSLRNLVETKEATINIISDAFIEAANATSIDAPPDVSEWDVSGLTAQYGCETVAAPRVKEAVVCIEARLDFVKEWESRAVPGKKSGAMAVLEGTRIWVREDALNEDRSLVDPAILLPIGRMGGITYSRTNEAFELTRPKFNEDLGGKSGLDKIKQQQEHQEQK